MPDNKLEQCRDNLFRCLKCGTCHSFCPTYLATLDETKGPRGRLALIQALLDGKLTSSKRLNFLLSTCLSCMACRDACPNEVNPVKIIVTARDDIADNKYLVSSALKFTRYLFKRNWALLSVARIIKLFVSAYNIIPERRSLVSLLPYARDGVKRSLPMPDGKHWRKEIPETVRTKNPVARVAYFTGCMTDLVCRDAGIAVIAFLEENNVEVWIPKNQICCGAPLYYSGDIVGATEMAKKNIKVLKAQSVDAIITSCATCGNFLKNIYPELIKLSGSFDLARDIYCKVTDVHKFIADRFLEKLQITSNIQSEKRIKVTYHDPCHLRRGLKIFREPRELLKSMGNLEYIEMDDPERCCGGSGLFSFKHYDLSASIGRLKVDSIRKTNAKIVATGCPSCQIQLKDMLKRENFNIEVLHTIQLLRRFTNVS